MKKMKGKGLFDWVKSIGNKIKDAAMTVNDFAKRTKILSNAAGYAGGPAGFIGKTALANLGYGRKRKVGGARKRKVLRI